MCASAAESRRSIWFTGEEHINTLILRKGQEQIPGAEYRKLQESFAGENFDAEKIARLAAETGMKYAVLTTRHHGGFSLYDTKGLNSFDSIHSPAGRDFTREFAEACRAEGIKPFFYHTTLDWMEEDFEKDFDRYLEYLRQSVEILCTEYGEIGGFWFDGNWSRPDADWKLDELYGMIRRLQPNALIINNTGLSDRGTISFSMSGRTGVGLFLRSCRRACGLSGGGCGSMVLPSMKDARIISAVRLMISA